MLRKRCLHWCVAVGVVMFAVGVSQAVTIEMVPVRNANNLPDTRYNNMAIGAVAKDYAIGKYEVTAGQYRDFLNAMAATDTYGLYNPSMDSDSFGCQITRHGTNGNYTYDFSGRPSGAESDWANRPVNFVSWGDAARFANWLQNGQPTGAQTLATTEDGAYYLNGAITYPVLMTVTRKAGAAYWIPSESEWYKAAYYDPLKPGGAGYWDYPTRSNTPPLNTLVNPDPGNHANFYTGANYTIGSPYYRTEVGEFENSASAYGTFDQGGNVFEWDEATILDTMRGWRGGSFVNSSGGLSAANRASSAAPSIVSSYCGFRIASVPEPGSITLLVVGALGLLAYAWRRRNGR